MVSSDTGASIILTIKHLRHFNGFLTSLDDGNLVRQHNWNVDHLVSKLVLDLVNDAGLQPFSPLLLEFSSA